MKVSEFDYDLPAELIAQEPLANRADSRLLVLNKTTGDILHTKFSNITDFLKKGDCLVINNTKVIPARLLGRKETGAHVEFLLLKELNSTADESRWEALVRPGKKLREGDKVFFNNDLTGEIAENSDRGTRVITLKSKSDVNLAIQRTGEMPLPPYIKTKLDDANRYQTIYGEKEGSAAAPTAGLHFTDQIFKEAENKGVKIAKVTLSIGLDTFRPVKVDEVESHRIHKEHISLDKKASQIINETKANGGRVVAVGTTSVRTIESCADDGKVATYAGETGIFIYPGYNFKITDCMITNFHLPRSTLLMLVSAFAGQSHIKKAYAEAIDRKYRFFSFGDAMLIC